MVNRWARRFELDNLVKGLWGYVGGTKVPRKGAKAQVQAKFQKKSQKESFWQLAPHSCTWSLQWRSWGCLGCTLQSFQAWRTGQQTHAIFQNRRNISGSSPQVNERTYWQDQVVTLLGSLLQSYVMLVRALEPRVDDVSLSQAISHKKQTNGNFYPKASL